MAVTAQQGEKFKVVIHGRIEGQLTNNVWYFQAATAIDDVDLRLPKAILECFVTHLLPVLSSAFRLEKLTWQRVSPTLGPEFTTLPVGDAVGAGTLQSYPSHDAVVISLHTLEGGKSKRGRTYLPGIPEDGASGSTIPSDGNFWLGVVAYVACLVDKFLPKDPQPANTFLWMVYSRKLGGATLPYNAAGFTTISEVIPRSLIGTIRSRKVGRGA